MNVIAVCSLRFNFPAFALLTRHLLGPFLSTVLGIVRGDILFLVITFILLAFDTTFFPRLCYKPMLRILSMNRMLLLLVMYLSHASNMPDVFFSVNSVDMYDAHHQFQ